MDVWKTGAVVAMALATASGASAKEKNAVTPSGRPEMVFAYSQLADAVVAVQSECMDLGWMVTSQTTNQVVCEIPMGVWQSALTQLAIGNSYSTTPKRFIRVSLAQVGENTRAQTQIWVETQMPFGQMRQEALTDDGAYNTSLDFLAQAGAQFPVGTTFNNMAFLGVNGEDASWQDSRRQRYGWRITSISEGNPADRLGLLVGDIIGKINNRTFDNQEGALAHLDRAQVGRPLALTVIRNGETMQFNTTAEGRPAITMLLRAEDIPQVEGATPAAAQIAVASLHSLEAFKAANGMAPAPADEAPIPPETELERARREAAEAQARLAAMEAAANPAESASEDSKGGPSSQSE